MKISNEKENENQQIEKIVKVILIAGIIILVPFILFTSNRRDPPHFIFGYLNENKKMGDYPTEAQIGVDIILHFFVSSFWSETTDIQVRHIVGKNTTTSLTSKGSLNGTSIKNFSYIIDVSERWESEPVITSFVEVLGSNEHYLIIFELWINQDSGWVFLENQIVYNRLNITN